MSAVDLAFARVALKRHLAYRVHWVVAIVLGGGGLLVGMAMWHNLLADGPIAGYDWDSMRAYLVLGFVTATLAFGGSDWQIADRILDGLIAIDLTKPVDFQRARAAEYLGSTASVVPTVVLGATTAWIAFDPPGPVTALAGVLAAMSVALIFPLSFGITYLSILVCFWTKRYLGVQWLRIALLEFFSGLMIPLALMPGWLQAVAWVLPFPHFTTTPTSIYLGRVDTAGALGLIAAQLAWAAAMWWTARGVWRHAVTKVTVHGG